MPLLSSIVALSGSATHDSSVAIALRVSTPTVEMLHRGTKRGAPCFFRPFSVQVALALDDGGVLVSYGGMSLRPIAIPGDVLQVG